MTVDDLKLRLKIPVIAAPMFLVSQTDLLISCSKSGILGTMPSLNARTNSQFNECLDTINNELKIQEGSSTLPYGINLIVHGTNARLQEDLQSCIKYKVPLVITSLGANKDVVDAIHCYGGLVFHDITTRRHAEKAIEVGVDGLIAVSAGAGGHAGTINPFALMDELRSFYQGPIALAGCINHGHAVRAALNMGADFAYMGTRFIATQESNAVLEYKNMVQSSSAQDIIYTDAISGVPANFLKESLAQSGVDISNKVIEDFSQLANSKNKAWKDIWSAGQGVGGIVDVPSVAELVNKLQAEFNKTEYKI